MTKIHDAHRAAERPSLQVWTLTQVVWVFAITGVLLTLSSTAFGGPILTEIHYNGVASGADPDEFIELSNPGEYSLDLAGWRFTRGITYVFGISTTLAPATSLVLARDPSGFFGVFPNYAGDIHDFSGALSNSGETLSLTRPDGSNAWSVSYDDSAGWPQQADGLGSSLQLVFGSLDATRVSNWTARPPTPGSWDPPEPTQSSVPTPSSIALLATGLLLLGTRHKKQFPWR